MLSLSSLFLPLVPCSKCVVSKRLLFMGSSLAKTKLSQRCALDLPFPPDPQDDVQSEIPMENRVLQAMQVVQSSVANCFDDLFLSKVFSVNVSLRFRINESTENATIGKTITIHIVLASKLQPSKGRVQKKKHVFYPHFVDKRFTPPPPPPYPHFDIL